MTRTEAEDELDTFAKRIADLVADKIHLRTELSSHFGALFQADLSKLVRLPKGAREVFLDLMAKGPANYSELKNRMHIPTSSLYRATEQLSTYGLIDFNGEYRCRVIAKGFALFCA